MTIKLTERALSLRHTPCPLLNVLDCIAHVQMLLKGCHAALYRGRIQMEAISGIGLKKFCNSVYYSISTDLSFLVSLNQSYAIKNILA